MYNDTVRTRDGKWGGRGVLYSVQTLLTVNAIDEAAVVAVMIVVVVVAAADIVQAVLTAGVITEGCRCCCCCCGRFNECFAGLIGHQRLSTFQQHILEVLGIGGRHVYRAQRAVGESSMKEKRNRAGPKKKSDQKTLVCDAYIDVENKKSKSNQALRISNT